MMFMPKLSSRDLIKLMGVSGNVTTPREYGEYICGRRPLKTSKKGGKR